MRKALLSLLILLTLTLSTQVTKAMTFAEGMNDSKPMALLIYANWADDIASVMGKFKSQEAGTYGDAYNFVLLDVASEDTKEFNKKYHIYPNLPYVLLYKNNGKVSRYLQKDCILDDACFAEKLKFFIN